MQTPRSPYQLMAGTVIPAALLTAVNSDLPGQVIATVNEHVDDTLTGRHLLVPQGSRLIGQYDGQVAYGQHRVLLIWTWLIRPDGSSLVLDRLPATDVACQSGLEDRVDWHWRRTFAGAALATLIGVGAELAGPDRVDAYDRIVIGTRQSVQDIVNQVGQQVTRRNLDLQPTLDGKVRTPSPYSGHPGSGDDGRSPLGRPLSILGAVGPRLSGRVIEPRCLSKTVCGVGDMADVQVTFKVEAGPGINSYWVSVGATRLRFESDVAVIALEQGRRTALTWWMRGTAGQSISILAHDENGKEVAKVEKSKVPRGEREGAGSRRITI